jgi:hypothetical protein
MTKDRPELAVVVYNDLKSNCDNIAQNLIDLTDFKVHGQYNLNIFHTKTITATLKDLAQQGVAWAVVVSVGNFLQDQTPMFKTIDHAMAENSPLACHILDRGGYYHFHQQWFAINLKIYQDIGCPAFETTAGSVELLTVTTERSPDNVHHDYTPLWVGPVDNQQTTYTSDYGYFGIRVLAELVSYGHTITNIPADVRNCKSYCYPEFSHDGIVKIINNPEYKPEDRQSPLWWFKKAIDQLTNSLKVGYYVLNTEHLYSLDQLSSIPMDCFVGVCGGLKPACIAGRSNFASDSKIYLFDISPAALEWQQHLIDTWDGKFENFESVFTNFKNQHPDYFPIYFTSGTIDSNLDWFLFNAGITQEEFTTLWQRYRNMQHYYVSLNLLDDDSAEQILKLVNSSNVGAYVWTSNAFKMDYLMFYRTNAWCEQHSLNFTNHLRNKTTKPLFLENCGSLNFLTNVK